MDEKLRYCSYNCKDAKPLGGLPICQGYNPLVCKKYGVMMDKSSLCLDYNKGLQGILKEKKTTKLKPKRKEGNPHSLASASHFRNNLGNGNIRPLQ